MILAKVLRKIYKKYRSTSIASIHYHKIFRAIAHAKIKISI